MRAPIQIVVPDDARAFLNRYRHAVAQSIGQSQSSEQAGRGDRESGRASRTISGTPPRAPSTSCLRLYKTQHRYRTAEFMLPFVLVIT